MSKILLCLTIGAQAAGSPALAQPVPDPPATGQLPRTPAAQGQPPQVKPPQGPPPPGQPDSRTERHGRMRPMDDPEAREVQSDRQTRTLKLGPEGEIALNNIAGDIVVTRGSGNDATIEIVKTVRARTADDARAMLAAVEVAVVERDGRAEVKAIYPRREGRGDARGDGWGDRGRRMATSVAYTVTAPARTRLTVGTVAGNVRVTDLRGDVSVSAVSGTVRIAGAGRTAEAKSVSGNVEVLDSQIDGDLEAQSVSGDVSVRKVSARRMEVGSVSGGVTLQDVQCDRVEGHSISGAIDYAGPLAKSGRYEFASHSGEARVVVTGGTGFELEARSFSGTVRSELPLKGQSASQEDRPGRGHNLQGVHGDGSAILNVTTFSGNIVIGKR